MLQALRNQFSAAEVRRCEKEGCKLLLDEIQSPALILDCDRYCGLLGLSGEMCDYFVFQFSPTLTVAVVDMKSERDVAATRAVEQIQAGASELQRIVDEPQAVSLYPILLHSGIKHTNELKVLLNRKVKFRGARYGIIYKRCGTRLLEILEQFQ